MNVRQLMSGDPITMGSEGSVGLALELMHRFDVRELPIVEGESLVGIVTDRDVKTLLGPGSLSLDESQLDEDGLQAPIRDIMSDEVATLLPEMPASAACRLLVERKVGAMPVTDHGGRLLGICSVTDLLSAAALLFEREE